MFASFKAATVALAAASVVLAVPHFKRDGQCNTGKQTCCNSIQYPAGSSNATDTTPNAISAIMEAYGVPVGLTCDPIPIVGTLAGASGCSSTPVCCDSTQDAEGSVIGINCIPITL